MPTLRELRGRHQGADVWLIAAGKSMDYVSPAFFANKITVGVNQVHVRFATDYLVVRDHAFFADVYRGAAQTGATLIAPMRGFVGPLQRAENVPPDDAPPVPWHTFEVDYPITKYGLDLDVVGGEDMIGGMSTLHTALHVCAYLGAANVMLCGADGGTLDGEKYIAGYRDGTSPNVPDFVPWLADVEQQTVRLRERLRTVYGCEVYSLNPFVNFGLEGHRYAHA